MLNIGDQAPDFSLSADTGEVLSLKQFRGKKVILYFYPKDATPGCTVEACSFRDHHKQFAAKDGIVLGVSKDTVAKHQSFKKSHELPFPLLADVDGALCTAYGVLKEKSMFGKKYMGIERSTFLIDEKGHIEKIWRKVSVMNHVQKVLAEV
jgi:peroxiredoxin Q/BCP